jgi:hypothetical protein
VSNPQSGAAAAQNVAATVMNNSLRIGCSPSAKHEAARRMEWSRRALKRR